LLHDRNGLKGLPFASLLKDPLEDLVEAEGGDQELCGCLDGFREELGIRAICEVLEPA